MKIDCFFERRNSSHRASGLYCPARAQSKTREKKRKSEDAYPVENRLSFFERRDSSHRASGFYCSARAQSKTREKKRKNENVSKNQLLNTFNFLYLKSAPEYIYFIIWYIYNYLQLHSNAVQSCSSNFQHTNVGDVHERLVIRFEKTHTWKP